MREGKLYRLYFIILRSLTVKYNNQNLWLHDFDFSVKFHLQGYTPHSLKYLSSGDVYQDENRDRERFEAWKVCKTT